jgi:hypothetical protein
VIRTTEHDLGAPAGLEEHPAAWAPALALARAGKPFGMPLGKARGAEAVAYVNWGRWVADCPTSGCGSAQVVTPADPRFFCPTCENAPAGGRWATVTFPSLLVSIERVLELRDDVRHRNWVPRESLTDLRQQNLDNGERDR